MIRFCQILFSLIVVSFGQGSWVPFLGIGASAAGYAIFWNAMCKLSRKRDRFWLSVIWFMAVQSIQISWMTSIQYMGPLIFIVYIFLSFLMGLQFGLLAYFFKTPREMIIKDCFVIAGCWVLLEWVRIFFFTGFTWNPVALSLASSSYAIQFASIFGVYGLSFWVIFVNCFLLYALGKIQIKRISIWLFLASIPYLYGFFQSAWVEKNVRTEKFCNVALLQTGILPEQKDYFVDAPEKFIPPLNQWERIWVELANHPSVDLIVLPEAAVSLSAYRPFYPIDIVKSTWKKHFGEKSLELLPPLESPFAELGDYRGEKVWKVSNAYIAQGLSNLLDAILMAGFDDRQASAKYNAAFCFHPKGKDVGRYEKRILVPIGEYVPFFEIDWIANFLSEQFGIGGSFDVGVEAKPFKGPVPTGVSICLEEVYSHLIRDLRLNGARLFVNMSNDVWFPKSRLPEHHFQHGKIRAAENGVYLLRSCNTGITGVIDCCGSVVKVLPASEEKVSVLYLTVPLRSFNTLYTRWGDASVLLPCLCFLLLEVAYKLRFRRFLSWG